jgi:hypothetical protein
LVDSSRDGVRQPVRSSAYSLDYLDRGLDLDGAACIANSRRCCRTHCRYTGPYHLAMIVPVLVLSVVSSEIYAWIALGVVIVGGSKLIWWATKRT